MTVEAMKAGAVEFLVKPFHAYALRRPVKEALQRSRAALECNLVCAMQNRHVSLSCREQEVMHWLIVSALLEQVSFELGFSEITVKAHRRRS